MTKSNVIKNLAENTISVETALNRLLVISVDINNSELHEWAKHELLGYDTLEKLPDYREKTSQYIEYSGVTGNFQVTNAPLPLSLFPEKYHKNITTVNFVEGIATIEQNANNVSRAHYILDLTQYAGIIAEETSDKIQCASISLVIPKSYYQEILNNVKTRLIEIFIRLEKEFGNLDSLDIDTTGRSKGEVNKINKQINVNIHTENSPTIGDNNHISKNQVGIKKSIIDTDKEKWYSKIAWKVIVPIFIAVIEAVVLIWIGLK